MINKVYCVNQTVLGRNFHNEGKDERNEIKKFYFAI